MHKWFIYLGVIVATVGFVMWYITYNNNLQATYLKEIAALQANNSTLKSVIDDNNKAMETLQNDYQTITDQYHQLDAQFSEFAAQNAILPQKLNNHDLNALSLAKPTLIEQIINKDSVNTLRCFDILSGAPLTKRELDAKNGNDFNSECPWLFGDINNNGLLNK